MKVGSQNICIITLQFPPYGKVAGRRWMLFARQLMKQGANVKVISRIGLVKESPWNADGIDIDYLKDNYPRVINLGPKSIIEKVFYRLWVTYLRFRFKGNPYDKGLFWLNKVKKFMISHSFANDTVFILSGAPFSLFSVGKIISDKGFKYILDYRDPHTWNNGYGYNQLSVSRQKYERASEKLAANGAFKIAFPNQEMIGEYCKIYPMYAEKCEVLPHPLDLQSITRRWEKREVKSNEINLVYAGTLYDQSFQEFKALVTWIGNNSNLHLTIFTHESTIPLDLKSLFSTVPRIYIKEAIVAKDLYAILNGFDAYLIIQSDAKKNYVTTKFVDLVYFEMPTVVHCAQGKLTDALSPLSFIKVVNTFDGFNISEWLQSVTFNKASVDVFLEKYAGKIDCSANSFEMNNLTQQH